MATEPLDPSAATAEVERARAQMRDRVASPLWFHLGLGLLVAQQTLVSGLTDSNWTIASFLVLLVGAVLLVALARRSTGITIASPRGLRSRNVMTIRFVAALACIWGAALSGNTTVVVLLTIVAFVATVFLGTVYDRALGADVAAVPTGT